MIVYEIKKGHHSFGGLWGQNRKFVYCELNEDTEDIKEGDHVKINEYDKISDSFSGRGILCLVYDVEHLGTMVMFRIEVFAWFTSSSLMGAKIR